MAPAAARWTLQLTYEDPFVLDVLVYFVVYPFLIARALHDRQRFGKVHPATLFPQLRARNRQILDRSR